jgi:hypothetical protein
MIIDVILIILITVIWIGSRRWFEK